MVSSPARMHCVPRNLRFFTHSERRAASPVFRIVPDLCPAEVQEDISQRPRRLGAAGSE